MSRADIYVSVAILAWLLGAYWIGDGLREQAEATDRQAVATFCTSLPLLSRLGEDLWHDNCVMTLRFVAGDVADRDRKSQREAVKRALKDLEEQEGAEPAVLFDPFDYKEGELPPCKSGAADCKPWERDWKGEAPPGATAPDQ